MVGCFGPIEYRRFLVEPWYIGGQCSALRCFAFQEKGALPVRSCSPPPKFQERRPATACGSSVFLRPTTSRPSILPPFLPPSLPTLLYNSTVASTQQDARNVATCNLQTIKQTKRKKKKIPGKKVLLHRQPPSVCFPRLATSSFEKCWLTCVLPKEAPTACLPTYPPTLPPCLILLCGL